MAVGAGVADRGEVDASLAVHAVVGEPVVRVLGLLHVVGCQLAGQRHVRHDVRAVADAVIRVVDVHHAIRRIRQSAERVVGQ
jgi:hypothetical protein